MDFERIAAQLFTTNEEHAKFLKKHLVVKKTVPLNVIFETYENTLQNSLAQLAFEQEAPSVNQFANAMEQLEVWPENLQKLKKTTNREQARLNATMRMASITSLHCDSSYNTTLISKEQNAAEANNKCTADAKQIFMEFSDFLETLSKTKAACAAQDVKLADLAQTLQQLQMFSRNVNQLIPADRLVVPAFNAQEEAALAKLLQQLQQYNCIQQNYNIFEDAVHNRSEAAESSLQQVTELLDFALANLQSFITSGI